MLSATDAGFTKKATAAALGGLQAEAVQEIAWKAQKRLCARYRSMEGRGKLKVQACTAVARELAGFIWAIAREVGPAAV